MNDGAPHPGAIAVASALGALAAVGGAAVLCALALGSGIALAVCAAVAGVIAAIVVAAVGVVVLAFCATLMVASIVRLAWRGVRAIWSLAQWRARS